MHSSRMRTTRLRIVPRSEGGEEGGVQGEVLWPLTLARGCWSCPRGGGGPVQGGGYVRSPKPVH